VIKVRGWLLMPSTQRDIHSPQHKSYYTTVVLPCLFGQQASPESHAALSCSD